MHWIGIFASKFWCMPWYIWLIGPYSHLIRANFFIMYAMKILRSYCKTDFEPCSHWRSSSFLIMGPQFWIESNVFHLIYIIHGWPIHISILWPSLLPGLVWLSRSTTFIPSWSQSEGLYNSERASCWSLKDPF